MTWQREAERQAAAAAPAEACGLLIVRRGRLRYLPCANVADAPLERFLIDPEAFAAAEDEGEVVAVVHSHPGASSAPSPADSVAQRASGLDWWILGDDGWRFMPAPGVKPYAGRAFTHGVNDCYSLIRDWFWRERGVLLSDYPRRDDWWEHGQDLYRAHFAECGFVEVAEARPGDALLLRIGAPVPNHAAIVLPGGRILHHLAGRISGVDTYDRLYRERTTHVLRHAATAAHDPSAG